MGETSIFTKIVRDEDDHTQLLCNLMNRCRIFRAVILRSFTNKAVGRPGLRIPIRTQYGLGEHGRADLLVKSNNLMMIVEVKFADSCAMTEKQVKGKYVKYLLREGGTRAKWLVYLVPTTWAYKQKVEDMLANIKNVNTRLITWEEVCLKIESPSCKVCDPFVRQFGQLLKPRFGPITFDAKEINLMFDRSFAKTFLRVRKLESLIDMLADKIHDECKERNKDLPPNERFHVSVDRNEDSYAAFLRKRNKPLLWIAICDGVPAPISFGIDENWEGKTPGLIAAFKSSKGIAPIHISDSYLHRRISKKVLNGGSPAMDDVWKALRPTVKNVIRAASK